MPIKRNTIQKKNRTIRRPVLSRARRNQKVTALHLFRCSHPIFGPVAYFLAVLILFSFIAVKVADGSYEKVLVKIPAKTHPLPEEKKPPVQAPLPKNLPARLEIPRIRVNALVEYVGILPNGSMGVPKTTRDVAWYMLGPKPGEEGSAVIAGHVNWWDGATGVFAQLHTLKPGDLITAYDDVGSSTSFVVRRSRMYNAKEDASDIFFSSDEGSHLNLVTCAGAWDKASKSYSKRLVVFADKVAE